MLNLALLLRRLSGDRHEPRLPAHARPCPLALVAIAGVASRRTGARRLGRVALVSAGVFGITFAFRGSASRRLTLLALLNAGVIATYTLVDGAWRPLSPDRLRLRDARLFLVNALPLVAWGLLARCRAFLAYARRNWPLGLAGGIGNLGSYGLALWAMTQAPVATVAALRETSILFGLAIAGAVLHERIGPARLAAAALIVLGAVSLRLA